jgi:hypothetical protein
MVSKYYYIVGGVGNRAFERYKDLLGKDNFQANTEFQAKLRIPCKYK